MKTAFMLFLGYFWILSPKWGFFQKISKFIRNVRKILWAILEKSVYVLTYSHTDLLTYWQQWFYRIPFCLGKKAGVQKSTLELQQFLRCFKRLFGHVWHAWTCPYKITWSICSFNWYEIACTQSNLHLH